MRIHRAGLSTLVAIEVINIDYNEEDEFTASSWVRPSSKRRWKFLDGYTYFREGEAVSLTREELSKIAKVVIRRNKH